MPSGGARPGAGRKPKIPVPPQDLSREQVHAVRAAAPPPGQRKAVQVMREVMLFFMGLAAVHQPTEGNPKGDPKKFREYALDAAKVASSLAPYETPTIQSIRLIPEELDLTKLSNPELGELERLHAKAAITDGDTPGAGTPLN